MLSTVPAAAAGAPPWAPEAPSPGARVPPEPGGGVAPPSPAPDTHGRLVPALLRLDARLTGRWDYWAGCMARGDLPGAPGAEEPPPRVEFRAAGDRGCRDGRAMLTRALDAIPAVGTGAGGGWAGWSGPEYFDYFLRWLLHGFGHPGEPEPPPEPEGCGGAGARLRAAFDLDAALAAWLSAPCDHLGDLLAENAYGRRRGFYPTPHTIAEMMTRMTVGAADGDRRRLTVCDPCVGTGRLLLHASNFSLRLYGMDVDALLCRATLVNGYLFAPWLVRPLPFLDRALCDPERSAAVSEAMAAQAPHVAGRLAATEHDAPEQWRFEPVKKRRSNESGPHQSGARQGVLF